MNLVNRISKKSFPMSRVGPYQGLSGEISIDARRALREWTVRIGIPEAVLALAPSVQVLAASREDRGLLGRARLSIRFDGETAVEIPLLGPHAPIPAQERAYWLMAVERELTRGVFLVDGTVVEAAVRLPAMPRSRARIRIGLGADIYTLNAPLKGRRHEGQTGD